MNVKAINLICDLARKTGIQKKAMTMQPVAAAAGELLSATQAGLARAATKASGTAAGTAAGTTGGPTTKAVGGLRAWLAKNIAGKEIGKSVGTVAGVGAAGIPAGYALKAMLDSGKISREKYEEMLRQAAATPEVPDSETSWDPMLNYALPVAGAAGGGALGHYVGGQLGNRTLGTVIGGGAGGGLLYLIAKAMERKQNASAKPTSAGDVKRGQMELADKEKAKGPGEKVSDAGAKAAAKTRNV